MNEKIEKFILKIQEDNSYIKEISKIGNLPFDKYEDVVAAHADKKIFFIAKFMSSVIALGTKKQGQLSLLYGWSPILVAAVYVAMSFIQKDPIFLIGSLISISVFLLSSPLLQIISKKIKNISVLLAIIFLFINIKWSIILIAFPVSLFLIQKVRKISEKIITDLALKNEILFSYFFGKKYLVVFDTKTKEMMSIDSCHFKEGMSANKIRINMKKKMIERREKRNKTE